MKSERIRFSNGRGQRLAAILDLPASSAPEAYALFAHCFTCGKSLEAIRHITGALAAAGIATLRFDFTGLGSSEGEFADTTFSSNTDDLVAASRWLSEEREPPKLLIGHSLGGAAVVQAADRIDSSLAVATIGAPYDPEHVTRLLAPARAEIQAAGEAEVVLAGRTFRIRKEFLEDLENHDPATVLRGLRRALLILHSPIDHTVSVDDARKAYVAALHPKSFIGLDGADHLLSDGRDARFAGEMIAAWARRYLGIEEHSTALDPRGAEVVVHTGPTGFRTDVLAAGHRLVADEPVAVGGTDLGPGPYDLLMSGLGACTSMTLRMYADRKGWDLRGATVHLTHRKVHVKDCDDCDSPSGRIDEITRELVLDGDLDAEQRARLLEIADKCPVHRSLHGEVKVRTSLGG